MHGFYYFILDLNWLSKIANTLRSVFSVVLSMWCISTRSRQLFVVRCCSIYTIYWVYPFSTDLVYICTVKHTVQDKRKAGILLTYLTPQHSVNVCQSQVRRLLFNGCLCCCITYLCIVLFFKLKWTSHWFTFVVLEVLCIWVCGKGFDYCRRPYCVMYVMYINNYSTHVHLPFYIL